LGLKKNCFQNFQNLENIVFFFELFSLNKTPFFGWENFFEKENVFGRFVVLGGKNQFINLRGKN